MPLICFALFFSCNKSNKGLSVIELDQENIPSMYTEEAVSLISDSGLVKYRITTKTWEMFSELEDPYWYFPDGLFIERFDTLFNVDFSMKADTVYYFEKKSLWHAIGNVHIVNMEGTVFDTSELFFNEKEDPNSLEAIYTDKPFRIEKKTKTTTGIGLRSNAYLTNFRMYRTSIEAIVEDTKEDE